MPVSNELLNRLQDRWRVLQSYAAGAEREALLAIHGADVKAIVGHARVDAALLAACPNARLVATFAVGYECVDLDAAQAAGVAVVNTPGVNAGEVADTAVMLLLAALKRLPDLDRHVRSGAWAREGQPVPRRGLAGLPVGVAGTGAVGTAVLKRLAAFGTELHCHARHPRSDLGAIYHNSVKSLAASCEALIIALPGGAGTRHAVDCEAIASLGPDGILVNIARGSVVDETALCDALEAGTLGYAALDVFENEPEVSPRLCACSNVILTPHYAGASLQARAAKADHLVHTLEAFFANLPLRDRVC